VVSCVLFSVSHLDSSAVISGDRKGVSLVDHDSVKIGMEKVNSEDS